jgi:hypothetical protein
MLQPRSNIVLVSNFGQFDPSEERSDQYKSKFENYLKLKNVFTDKSFCSQLFLNSIGSTTYDLLTTFASPKDLSVLTYD